MQTLRRNRALIRGEFPGSCWLKSARGGQPGGGITTHLAAGILIRFRQGSEGVGGNRATSFCILGERSVWVLDVTVRPLGHARRNMASMGCSVEGDSRRRGQLHSETPTSRITSRDLGPTRCRFQQFDDVRSGSNSRSPAARARKRSSSGTPRRPPPPPPARICAGFVMAQAKVDEQRRRPTGSDLMSRNDDAALVEAP